jgi:hypothetical protein
LVLMVIRCFDSELGAKRSESFGGGSPASQASYSARLFEPN